MKAPVTKSLVIINSFIWLFVLAFAYIMGGSGEGSLEIVQNAEATFGLTTITFLNGAYWQPLTSMFMHGPIWHILVNMLALWSIGTPIEMTIGSKDFFFLYFISGLTSALAVILLNPHVYTATLGASGAILGILGALAVFYPDARLLVFFFPLKAKTAAYLILLLSVVFIFFQLFPHISHSGHLGGLIGGLLFSKYLISSRTYSDILAEQRQRNQKNKEYRVEDRFERTATNNRNLLNSDETELNTIDDELLFTDTEISSSQTIYYNPETGRYYTKD